MDAMADDGTLIGRWLEHRDEAAWSGLVVRHGAMVAAVARQQLGGSGADADDVAQAVFLVLLRKAPGLAGRRDLGGWLHLTTVNIARRAAIARQVRRHRESDRPSAEPAMNPPDQDADTRQQVHAALACLPECQRQAVVLVHLEGMTQQAAADRLGVPLGTVGSWLSRGAEQLRRRLLRAGVAVPAAGALALLLAPTPGQAAEPMLTTLARLPSAGATPAATALAQITTTGAAMAIFAAAATLAVTTAAVLVLTASEPQPPVAAARPAAPAAPLVPTQMPEFGVEFVLTTAGYNARADGLEVQSVTADGTAARLGIQPGDVLVSLSGRPSSNVNLYARALAAIPAGSPVTVELLRAGKPLTVRGTMLGRPIRDDELPVPWPRFVDHEPLRRCHYSGSRDEDYEARFDVNAVTVGKTRIEAATVGKPRNEAVLQFRSTKTPIDGFGTWMSAGPQGPRLDQVRGKRVRFSARLRTSEVTDRAGIWIRADVYDGDTDCTYVASFDNMKDRALSGTTGWTDCAVVIDVPQEATGVLYGVRLRGTGSVWIADPCLEEVGPEVPSTSLTAPVEAGIAEARQRWRAFREGLEAGKPIHETGGF